MGPLKAFDKPASASESNLLAPEVPRRERSPKRMAPSAPTSNSQSKAVPTEPPPSTTQSATSTSFTSSVMSAVKGSSGSAKTPLTFSTLTKPLSVPTAPPRRKHGNRSQSEDRSRTPIQKQKSKDDTELGRSHASRSDVKSSPVATVGKMWRPMSMSSSASGENENEETYHSYNNFDVLREMNSERLPLSTNPRDQVEDKFMNGHGHTERATISAPSSTPSSSSKAKSGAVRKLLDKGSVSAKSFAFLKEKVSEKHSNTVKQVLTTVYTSEDFGQATGDVDRLLAELKQTMESLKSSRIDRKPVQFNMCKEELQTQVRQFVTDAKLLVSNATQTKAKLAVNMDASMHSLVRIFLHGQATMFMMEAIHQAQHLGSEVMRVANAYKSTLNAAHAAVGKPLSDPHMKYLMRQATNLASLLSTLLKSLKTLEQK